MKHKLKKRLGFTLIEVTLFIGITAMLFAGVVAGTNMAIERQRYYDAVQNFAEFLRRVYSEVSNPQSIGDGRSDEAIYGKLVVFGEKYEVDAEGMGVLRENNDTQRIYVYDVVGDTDIQASGSAQKALVDVHANVVHASEWAGNNVTKIAPVGLTEVYEPRWAMSVETVENKTNLQRESGDTNLYNGSILIVRHPRSGTINTLVTSAVVKVNEMIYNTNTNGVKSDENGYIFSHLLTQYLEESAGEERFRNMEVDFCMNEFGWKVESDRRWDIRLVNNARNASGVEVIALDADEIQNGVQVGNRCRVFKN